MSMKIKSSYLKQLYKEIQKNKLIQYPPFTKDFSDYIAKIKPNVKNGVSYYGVNDYPVKLLHFRNWEDLGQEHRQSMLFQKIKEKLEFIKNDVNERYNLMLCVCENNEANFNYYPSRTFIPPHVDRHPYTILTLLDTDYLSREENSLYYLNSFVDKDIHHLKELYRDFNNQLDKSEQDYTQFRDTIKKQTNVCEIKLNKGDSIFFNGGKYIHFTIPKFSGYREIATLNFM